MNKKKVIYSRRCGDYEADGIFYHDAKQCIYRFVFPELGDNATLKTNILNRDSRYITNIFLSDNYLIRNGEIVLEIPNNLNIEILEFNFEGFEISKNEVFSKKSKIITYKLKDIYIPNYENMPGSTWILPHLVVISKGYTINGEYKKLFDSNEDMYLWLSKLLPRYSEQQEIKSICDEINKNNKTEKQKLEAALYWTQKNIRYIAFEDGIAGLRPEPIYRILKKHYADCKGMSNLLYFIIKELGSDARRCWVSTNHLAYSQKFPSLASDNHMICAVKTDTGFIYLDATNKYSNLGEPIEYLQGRIVAIEDGDNIIFDTIAKNDFRNNQTRSIAEVRQDSGSLMIYRDIYYNGASKNNIKSIIYEYLGADKEKYIKSLIKGYSNNLYIDSISFHDNLNNFNIYLEMKGGNILFKQAGKIFVPLDIEYGSRLTPIDTNRNISFSFGYRQQKTYTTKFYLKDNQHIAHLPKNTKLDFQGFGFQFSWKEEDKIVTYNKILDIKELIIDKKDFKDWNIFVEEYNKLSNESIILNEDQ
ncbi:MAG: hypothetical protein GXO88_06585 [Chlorobi bacterium]|nr:hypothetical protein [Chlorobiota bacterium]